MRRRAKVWLRSLCAHLCFCVSSLPPDTLTRMQTCWSVQNRISDINTHMNYWCTANPQPHIRPFIYYQPGSQRGCTAVSLGKISANCLCLCECVRDIVGQESKRTRECNKSKNKKQMWCMELLLHCEAGCVSLVSPCGSRWWSLRPALGLFYTHTYTHTNRHTQTHTTITTNHQHSLSPFPSLSSSFCSLFQISYKYNWH